VTVNAGGRVYTGTTYATNRKTGICDVFCTIPANTPVVVSYQVDWTGSAADSSSQALVFINKA
ncbi:hypothetical protein D6J78_26635, partial [Salmonella enterica subsp. enterica serovar Abaetetuba]|nr:hypothetical protein [Salmonella enterica subsp. enterica serovar Abaetetuba]